MEQEIVTLEFDLAKNVFQVHAIAADGAVLIGRKLRRSEVIRFFTELPPKLDRHGSVCLGASLGARVDGDRDEVRLIPPAYVKPYVKSGKIDAANAEAICEAVTRPTMRFCRSEVGRAASGTDAPQKSRPDGPAAHNVDQRASQPLNGVRDRDRRGTGGAVASLKALHEEQERFPAHARLTIHGIATQLRALVSEINRLEAQIRDWHRNDETSRRLAKIPEIGPITASAIAAAAPDPVTCHGTFIQL